VLASVVIGPKPSGVYTREDPNLQFVNIICKTQVSKMFLGAVQFTTSNQRNSLKKYRETIELGSVSWLNSVLILTAKGRAPHDMSCLVTLCKAQMQE